MVSHARGFKRMHRRRFIAAAFKTYRTRSASNEARISDASSDLSKKTPECGLFQAELTDSPSAALASCKNSQVRSSLVK